MPEANYPIRNSPVSCKAPRCSREKHDNFPASTWQQSLAYRGTGQLQPIRPTNQPQTNKHNKHASCNTNTARRSCDDALGRNGRGAPDLSLTFVSARSSFSLSFALTSFPPATATSLTLFSQPPFVKPLIMLSRSSSTRIRVFS